MKKKMPVLRSKPKTMPTEASGAGRALISLLEAPREKPLRIVDVSGGEHVRRRLLALGFHRGDIIALDSQAIMNGPLLIWNMAANMRIALGRGVAKKIRVEIVDGHP